MKDSMTLDRVVNSIIMRKNKYENFILVEGTLDRLFFLKFKKENTQIEMTFGWENLVKIIKKVKERGYDKIIGIIDKDLRDIIPLNSIDDEDIVETDFHDINIQTIDKTFEIIFQNNCSQEKVENFKNSKGIDCLKTYTFKIAEHISYLRLLNHRENLHISFKTNDGKKNKVDYTKFIDKNKFEFISKQKMIETFTNFSRPKSIEKIIDNKIINDKLEKLMKDEKYDFKMFINGHDFSEIICIGLKKILGTREVEGELFLKDCILAYQVNDFKKTNIYKKIKILEHRKDTELLK